MSAAIRAESLVAEPRLIPRNVKGGSESLAAYAQWGGATDLPAPDVLTALVESSGLRGRGGAAFPLATKLSAILRADAQPCLVVNGEEGEPMSVKDRWLMRMRPHLVLDGIRVAARILGISEAVVYLSDPESATAITEASRQWSTLPDVRVHLVAPSYVAGEETAAVSAINGGAALPVDKPPRPYQTGVDGRPTLVSNVETLANLPILLNLGVESFRAEGTETSPGTCLVTLGGGVKHPGLYEMSLGTPLSTLVDASGGLVDGLNAIVMGGYAGGLLAASQMGLPLDYDTVRAAGSNLGCCAVAIVGRNRCPLSIAADVLAFFAQYNAGQCGVCVNGTAAMARSVRDLCGGSLSDGLLESLQRWGSTLARRGACGTLDAAALTTSSLFREFDDLIERHGNDSCELCQGHDSSVPFAAELPTAVSA